jgi:hypothetical protein
MSSVALRRSPRLAQKANANQKAAPSYAPVTTPKRNLITERVFYEMKEFRDKIYETEFTEVEYPSDDTVNVTHLNGNRYQIHRNRNFLGCPPAVTDLSSGEHLSERYTDDDWRPCLTSVKWFLMVVTNQ